jgi:hypothetical protein
LPLGTFPQRATEFLQSGLSILETGGGPPVTKKEQKLPRDL